MKWLWLHVGGQKIDVHLVRRKHPMLLGGSDGTYHPDKGRIYIASDLEEGSREDTLLHELDHAVNEVAGVNRLLSKAFERDQRMTPEELSELEESIVSVRTTVWHRLLKDLGFRFPRGIHR